MEKFDKTLVLTGSIVVAPAEDIAGVWVGHCLDFDIISQGDNPNEAIEAVIEAVAMAILDDLQAGLDPCDRPRAPDEDWVRLAKVLKHGQQVKLSDVKADHKMVLATLARFVFEPRAKHDHDGFDQFNVPPETAHVNHQWAA
ncbi:MAG TPA: hypothetical protein VHT91_29930 [Kofleriaceae bacterium]|jgi:hypothetical protein|nr:hypothetical protein [Kofleriaceae bacterium]